MDILDRAIVQLLSEDARMPFLRIGKRLGVAEGTVRKRMEKMRKDGAIKKFTVIVGEDAEGMEVLVGLKTDPHAHTPRLAKMLAGFEGMKEVYEITGRFDLICRVRGNSGHEINNVLEKIRRLKEVLETESFTIIGKA